ncbi:hypothetical protein SLEP1_g52575 [Rubroshorea leprosula]|uniref:PGG domain-containing protein n=1 Tax=Rubroshorea leprosula TaxID=152421 RepID=A0AAV5M6P7_9ROSI|nr:hypothetical protein SLEP1_g52575 [Rubroshorea leprosula]
MDARLIQAAQIGSIEDLHELLRENPLILHTVNLFSIGNPLHIASASGHDGFVMEITRLKPEFTKELNRDGFNPMHMAAANGHLEVVRELLKVDRGLSCLEGREKKTPLHYAAIKGRVDEIIEMLMSSPECIGHVTIQGETALHLAIKNSKVEAARVLVDWVREMKNESVLNLKDEQGNTVIELLLGWGSTHSSLEVNAINQSGLTALDLLQIFPSKAGDLEIAEILQRNGARRARDLTASQMPTIEYQNQFSNIPTTPERPQSHPRNLLEYFKFKKGRDSPSEARTVLLLVASLVATSTFQMGLSPPGGTWQDNYVPDQNKATSTDEAHVAGTSILATSDRVSFLLFALFNSIGFVVSFHD